MAWRYFIYIIIWVDLRINFHQNSGIIPQRLPSISPIHAFRIFKDNSQKEPSNCLTSRLGPTSSTLDAAQASPDKPSKKINLFGRELTSAEICLTLRRQRRNQPGDFGKLTLGKDGNLGLEFLMGQSVFPQSNGSASPVGRMIILSRDAASSFNPSMIVCALEAAQCCNFTLMASTNSKWSLHQQWNLVFREV